MSIPTFMFPALVAGDGTLYQDAALFKRGACYAVNGAYWLSSGLYSVMSDARRGFFKYNDFPNSESNGVTSFFGPISGATVNGSALRIGIVADPDDATKRCWLYRVNINDPDTAGAGNKRSELSGDYVQMALRDRDRGHTLFFSTRYCDISATTTGEQLISQVHASNTNTGCPPWYAIILGPGPRLQIKLRYDPNETTSNETNVSILAYDGTFTPLVWDKWCVEYRQSHNGQDGFCRVWRNRVQIVNYSGPLGYVDNGGFSYLKAGIYHFTDAGYYAFDPTVPTRECWQKGPYQCPIGVIPPVEVFDFLDSI